MAKKTERRAAERLRQDFAVRELTRVARLCPTGIARQILLNVGREHRETTQDERQFVKDVRDRGGVCFPGGMSQEEWRNRLPKSLHGRKARCVPADELAQELYDRGVLPDASSDTVLDLLGEAYLRARSAAAKPTEKELMKQAKKILEEQIRRAARELVSTARRQGLTECPTVEARRPAPAPAQLSGASLEGG